MLRFPFGRLCSPPTSAWVFAHGGGVLANQISLLSATPPSHLASTQKMSVFKGGISVPELWYFSVGTSWLLSTSSSSLIALSSSSSCFWTRREHEPVSQMLTWPTHSSLISPREIYFVISLDIQDHSLALNHLF